MTRLDGSVQIVDLEDTYTSRVLGSFLSGPVLNVHANKAKRQIIVFQRSGICYFKD